MGEVEGICQILYFHIIGDDIAIYAGVKGILLGGGGIKKNSGKGERRSRFGVKNLRRGKDRNECIARNFSFCIREHRIDCGIGGRFRDGVCALAVQVAFAVGAGECQDGLVGEWEKPATSLDFVMKSKESVGCHGLGGV